MLFRVDLWENFEQIKDCSFRLRRWSDGRHNRDILLPVYERLSPGLGLYRICFFKGYEALIKNAGLMFLREFVVHSIAEETVFADGNTVVVDTEVGGEAALLIYRIEALNGTNEEWSSFNVPFLNGAKVSSRSVVMDFESGKMHSAFERFIKIMRNPLLYFKTTRSNGAWRSIRRF